MEDIKPQAKFSNGNDETSPLAQKLSDDGFSQSTFDERSISRNGRVRKPKVFYDPSDVDAKRRSLPNVEFKKPKSQPPAPKTPEIGNDGTSMKIESSTELTTAADPFKKPCHKTINPPPSQKMNVMNFINKRRQTIGPANFENGCIVCTRCDTNKGRFVNCMDCIKRGHFTCLRTAKLFKTADTEKSWQCPSCKICMECRNHDPVDDLVKCLKCYNSYHVKCINVNPRQVIRKRFICTPCARMNETESTAKEPIQTEAPKLEALDIIKMSDDGFAGFSRDETAKRKINDSQSATTKTKKSRKQKTTDDSDSEIKSETSETKNRNEQFPNSPPNANRNDSMISVRKDLVACNDDDLDIDELQYNTKTAIRPHEDVPDVRTWDCDTVYVYFRSKTNDEYANLLKENQIDGDALLLIKREDVLNRFNLKLGPALRLYSHIVALQCRNSHPILAWN